MDARGRRHASGTHESVALRGGRVAGDTSGIRDSVVNQLLAIMDGVDALNNILVIGLTNRRELMDPALLRPGRLEVQVRRRAKAAPPPPRSPDRS
eukprot:5949762-Prymnesium_polylepis.1